MAHDQSLFELTPDEVVRAFTEPRTIHWKDGATTTLRLEADEVGTTCFAAGNPSWHRAITYPPLTPEDPALFAVSLTLSITTEDGRFASRMPIVLQYQARKTGGLERAWISSEVDLAPGDSGGWAADAADHGTRRMSVFHLGYPPTAASGGSGRLLLLGPPGPSECSSTTKMCLGTPGLNPTLVGGTIE